MVLSVRGGRSWGGRGGQGGGVGESVASGKALITCGVQAHHCTHGSYPMWGVSVGVVLGQGPGGGGQVTGAAQGLPPSFSTAHPVSLPSLHTQRGSRSFFRPKPSCLLTYPVPITSGLVGLPSLPSSQGLSFRSRSSKTKYGSSSHFIPYVSSPSLAALLGPLAGIPVVVSSWAPPPPRHSPESS